MANNRNLERNSRTTLALHKLFIEIISTPSSFSDQSELRASLSTQITIGALSIPGRDIYPCSMSTIKRRADELLDGGYDALDKLRKQALEALHKVDSIKNHRKDGKAAQAHKISELKSEIQMLRQEIFLRDTVILRLSNLLTSCAGELNSPNKRDAFLKFKTEELYRLGFKGTNIDER